MSQHTLQQAGIAGRSQRFVFYLTPFLPDSDEPTQIAIMIHRGTVLAVAFLHYVLRITAFIEPLATHNNATPTLLSSVAGTLVLASICMLLFDSQTDLCPPRYGHRMATAPRLVVETIAVFLLVEFGMIVVWSRVEQVIQVLVRWLLVDRLLAVPVTAAQADQVAGVLSAAAGLAVYCNTAWVTCYWTLAADRLQMGRGRLAAWMVERWHQRLPQTGVCGAVQTAAPAVGQTTVVGGGDASGEKTFEPTKEVRQRRVVRPKDSGIMLRPLLESYRQQPRRPTMCMLCAADDQD